ncbi:hypothetical protein ACKKBG_A35330 [Auxenochlorella protothecoides x Auxenochlorella symbiontica]
MMVRLVVLGLLALALAPPVYSADFVKVDGLRFTSSNCTDFKPVGWNGWSTLSYAANKKSMPGFNDGRAFLTNMFKEAQALNFNVYRFFIQGDYSFLTTSAGQYDEQIFQGFDFVLDEAAKYNIKLTPILLNLWIDDGVPLFEKFCGSDSSNYRPTPSIDLRIETTLNASERLQTPYKWYTDPDCRQYVKDFITKVVTRVNTINGIAYKDDPTIFSWNMLNEPRCKYCGPEAVTEWYHDIAAHLKSVDPNHLVTTGEEGFFDESSSFVAADPTDGNKWGPRSGQDFVANHDSPNIDYTVIHMWPDNWGVQPNDIAFGKTWIDFHTQASTALGKPLLMEEFGKGVTDSSQITSFRDPWYSLTYDAATQSIAAGGALRGALFWLWDGSTQNGGDGVVVGTADSTISNIVGLFADEVKSSCRASAPASTAAPGRAGASPAASRTGASPPASPSSIDLFQVQVPSTVAAAGRKLLAH